MAATTLNDNLQLNAPKPLDNKYYNGGLTAYASVSEANTAVVQAYRYRGLTVGILVAGVLTEYWWFAGVTNGDLVVKDLGQVPSSRTITGDATISGGGDLSANRVLSVVENTTNQKVGVRYNSASIVGTRKTINFIPGTDITLTIADNPGADQVDVTVAYSGSGGGGGDTIEEYDYVVTGSATSTVSVVDSIGASGVFPAYVFPTPLFTSTSDASPGPDEVYANLTTGLWTFGTQLEVGQIVSFRWWRASV